MRTRTSAVHGPGSGLPPQAPPAQQVPVTILTGFHRYRLIEATRCEVPVDLLLATGSLDPAGPRFDPKREFPRELAGRPAPLAPAG